MKISVIISALVYPTESAEKVEAAIKKLFPDIELRLEQRSGFEDRLTGIAAGSASLEKLRQLLRRQKILDTARRTFFKSKQDNAIEFKLNKQVAYIAKVNFVEEEIALGPIYIRIEAEDIDRLIDWLAPLTEDGKPIREIEL